VAAHDRRREHRLRAADARWKKDAIATRVDEMLALLQLEGFGRGR
jgi:hypothetical protein